jgi:hypothetical protein
LLTFESILSLVRASPLLSVLNVTGFGAPVRESGPSRSLFRELCSLLATRRVLRRVDFSETDYADDTTLPLLLKYSPATQAQEAESKPNASSNFEITNSLSSNTLGEFQLSSPIRVLVLFNLETVTDKFLSFLATDEHCHMLR